MAKEKIEHRIGILAPADVIWASLIDVASWPEWTGLYTRASGVIRIGEVLDLEVSIPGQAPRAIQPRILDWAPNDHIHWKLSLMHGLVSTVRYMEIEDLEGAPGCIFSNGEIFGGLLGARLAWRERRSIRAGFTLLGEGLKTRAEAAVAAGAVR